MCLILIDIRIDAFNFPGQDHSGHHRHPETAFLSQNGATYPGLITLPYQSTPPSEADEESPAPSASSDEV